MSSRKRVSAAPIYQLKITLKDSKPPIWRRILVPGDASLAKLHRILQAVMGWWNCHLHEFTIHGLEYGEPNREFEAFGNVARNEKNWTLLQLVGAKERFVYQYDFGDDWLHQIVVEKVVPRETGQRYPVCLAGKMACPPEDCGGIWGYMSLLKVLADPSHEEHESMLEWAGGMLDPEAFNVDWVNQQLRGLK